MNKKQQKIICVDDIDKFKGIAWNKMRMETPPSVDRRWLVYRFKHMERVADISYQLIQMYVSEYKKCEKKYDSKKTKLTKVEYHQVKEIIKNDVLTSVVFLGLIHDIYKFRETDKVDHGELASEFFKVYCKNNKLKMSGLVKQMNEAVKYHSEKGKNLNNIYYKILVDADILSKYSEENFKEKMIRNHTTFDQQVSQLKHDLQEFKPKTPFYYTLVPKYKNSLISLSERGVFDELNKKAKEGTK